MNKNALLIVILIIVVIGIAIGGYLYWQKTKTPTGAIGTAEEVSENVPKIATNPGEEVPEVNPLDRANPFKYQNPLR